MIRKISYVLGVILLVATIQACSSPEEKAADYIRNADALFEEGKLQKAAIEYKNALQVNQNQPDAWFGLARIHERKQEWRQAYGVLNKIRELAPNHVDGRIMLGQMLLASNQIDQALTDTKEIMELAPDDARSHSLMAAVQFRLENYAGTQEEIDKALAIDAGNTEAILVQARLLIAEKKYDEALQILDKTIAANPENVSMYLMKIQAHAQQEDSKAVEMVYLELVKQFPDNNAFKTALARQYLSAKNVDAAEGVLEQIVESDPENVDEKIRLVGFKNQFRTSDDAVDLLKAYIASSPEEYRYRFLLAELYERNKQPDEAMAVYQDIVTADELQANGLEARNKIALIELRTGNRDKAEALVNEVLTQDKANENGLLLQAGFQINDRNFDDAVVSARTVLRDNPDSVKALALLGQAYNAMGSRELAVESYTKAFQLNPGIPVVANQLVRTLVAQRKFQQADEMLQASFARGNRSVESIRLFAQVKLSLGEWEKAEEIARQLEKVEGQEAVSQQLLGVVYQGKQEQGASIEAFKRAHELAPDSPQPIAALVQTYVRDGKVDEAKRFLNKVLSLHSENVNAYLLLGQLSLYEKDTATAVKHYNKVIEINPNIDAPYRNLAAIYTRSNDLGQAEAVLKRGLEAMPDRPILVMTLASIYERGREFEKAIKLYESLLENDPNLIVAKNNLASLLTDYRQDRASLDKARTISAELKTSQIPQFRDTYAWASVKADSNLEEAVAILEGIVKENEQVGVYNYHLGEAYRKKGDKDNAIAYLEKAIKQSGPNSDITRMANESLQQIN